MRIKSSDLPSAIASIEKIWHNLMPHQPFRYSFLDERFAMKYKDVLRMGRIFAAFATLAIVVACLALFALSAFMTQQRSKEISIRLVMGASVKKIFWITHRQLHQTRFNIVGDRYTDRLVWNERMVE